MDTSHFDEALRHLYAKHKEDEKDVSRIADLCFGLNIRSYHDLAIKYAHRGLSLLPGDPKLFYELIIANSLDTGHILEDILSELQDLLEDEPKDLGIRQNIALTHYFLEQDEEAETILKGILDENDDNADPLTYEILAQLEFTRQDMDQCIAFCDLALEGPDTSARMVRLKGLCYQELGERKLAIENFRKALEVEPWFVWACHSLGGIYTELGQYPEALRYFGKATYINPNDPGNLFLMAEAFMDMDLLDLAAAELSKLLLLKPEKRIEAEVHNALGFLWLKKEDTDQATFHLNQAIELEPELSLAYFNLGQLAQQKKDYEGAEAHFQKALDLDPQLSESWVEMGFLYMLQNRDEEARSCFEMASEVDTFDAQAFLGLSKLSQKENDAEAQLSFAIKSYEFDPDHSEICNNLAIAHECNDSFDEAEEYYLRALDLNDLHAAAANNLGYLYEKKMSLYPEQSDTYRNKALQAWRERLRICLAKESSTEAATTHLKKLGLDDPEINSLIRSYQLSGERNDLA